MRAHNPELRQHDIDADRSILRTWRSRAGWPTSLWGWLLWVLIALLLYLLISYVLVPWGYRPVPTDIPTAPSNSNTRST